MSLVVDVVSDFVCPWCWIAKTGLDKLKAERPEVVTRWHPYLLNPDVPKEGIDRREMSIAKFGSIERARELAKGVEAAAAEQGLIMDLSKVKRVPDTRAAHCLMRWAQGRGVGDAVADALFRAHFDEGRDIGDIATLTEIGVAAGLDASLLAELFADNADRAVVEHQAGRARHMGVSGVPTMIFAGKFAVVGAQPIEKLRKAADAALAG